MTMKLNLKLLIPAIALAWAGCSEMPTTVDTGTIHARTFSFVNRENRPAADFADNREAVHAMIQEAIRKNLAAHGVTQVATGGDVTVGYLVIIGNQVSTTEINDYFGYGEGATELADKAHDAYTLSKNPNDFDAGTLLIDITDGKTYKLLKRGYATRTLQPNLTQQAREAKIQGVVDQIFTDLRVAP
jgi:Domain of unknown function (DUF4136)